MNLFPRLIIFEDKDSSGFWILEFWRTELTSDNVIIPIYIKKDYYHDLESAIRDI